MWQKNTNIYRFLCPVVLSLKHLSNSLYVQLWSSDLCLISQESSSFHCFHSSFFFFFESQDDLRLSNDRFIIKEFVKMLMVIIKQRGKTCLSVLRLYFQIFKDFYMKLNFFAFASAPVVFPMETRYRPILEVIIKISAWNCVSDSFIAETEAAKRRKVSPPFWKKLVRATAACEV